MALALALSLPEFCGAEAVGGVLDLRQWSVEETISLEGEWEYFEGAVALAAGIPTIGDPGETRLVPDIWPTVSGSRGYGSATYRLVVLLPSETPPLDLRLSRVLSAYQVFINGREVASAGTVGKTRHDTVPSRSARTVRLTPYGDTIEIAVEVANFHYFRGGFARAPLLGPAGTTDAGERRRQLLEFFVLGGLVTVGLYHLGLASQRPEERPYLLFGVVALMLSLRVFLTGTLIDEKALQVLGWEPFTTVMYLTLFVGFPLFVAYCRSVFPAEFHRPVLIGFVGLSGVFVLAAVVLPSWIYTATLQPYLGLSSAMVVYIVVVATRAALHSRDGATVFLIGTVLLAAALTTDAVAGGIPTRSNPLLPLGALVFTFFQAVILSNRVSRSINEVEELVRIQQRLIGENESLKDLTYIDALTGIGNRRRFNETLEVEWSRGIRHGRPLSLLMIDIDHFKAYNDAYGHGQGDYCLQQVASVLSNGLRRTVDFVARYGGEEFAVVLPDTDAEGALSVAEHLRNEVESHAIAHSQSPVAPVVTISAGAATTIPSTKTSPYHLVEIADRGLYSAKQHGRNRVSQTT